MTSTVQDLVGRLREHADRVADDGPSGPNYDPETLDLEHAAADEIARLRTVLNAWYETFGTTQLTHARCRLETAERAANAPVSGSPAELAGYQEDNA